MVERQVGNYISFDRMNKSLVLFDILNTLDNMGFKVKSFYVNEDKRRIEIIFEEENNG